MLVDHYILETLSQDVSLCHVRYLDVVSIVLKLNRCLMFSLSFQNPHHLQQLKLHNLVYLLLVAQIQNVVWSVEAHLVSVDQITLEVHQTVGQNVQLILTVLLVKPA